MKIPVVALLLTITAACADSAPTGKAPPTDDPIVDGGKTDSLRAPKMLDPVGPQKGTVLPQQTVGGEFTATTRYLGLTLTLGAKDARDVWVGGLAADGSPLDTVAYLYGPKDAHGKRGRYLRRNDDRNDLDLGSRFVARPTRGAGDYLIVVTTYTKPDPGNILISIDCAGDAGCPVVPIAGGPAPAKRVSLAPRENPEVALLGANTDRLDLLTELVAADVQRDPFAAASELATLYHAKILLDRQPALQAALDAAFPTAAEFAAWPERAQAILLKSWWWGTVDVPAGAPSGAALAADLVASWPMSKIESGPGITAFGKGGALYGYVIGISLSNGDLLWNGDEPFSRAGVWLGDSTDGFSDWGD